jgi:hypothetical protein
MSVRTSDLPVIRSCGTPEVDHRLLEDREYQSRRVAIEHFTSRFLLFDGHAARTQIITIPAVVHVVYRDDSEKISGNQVQSQFGVLNEDFRLKNADAAKIPDVWKNIAADARIEFALATKDPGGAESTGITYTKTDRTGFSMDDAVKSATTGGADPWPSDRYLNVWVCSLGRVLGYAYLPGGTAELDGVVIRHTAFGTVGTAARPFHLGRTATHEIGHWLNLIHIWGDRLDCTGTDLVDDTPTSQRPNYETPRFPSISCNNGPAGDMFMNYMDYVNDEAMYMFTAGQVARMSAALDGPRNLIGRA